MTVVSESNCQPGVGLAVCLCRVFPRPLPPGSVPVSVVSVGDGSPVRGNRETELGFVSVGLAG